MLTFSVARRVKNTIHDIQAVFVVGLAHYNAEMEEARIDRLSRTQRARISLGVIRLTTELNGEFLCFTSDHH